MSRPNVYENLGTILQEKIPGTSMIQSPSQGNIPKTSAKYDRDPQLIGAGGGNSDQEVICFRYAN